MSEINNSGLIKIWDDRNRQEKGKAGCAALTGSGVSRLNHQLLMSLGLSKESATLVVDRITELKVELEKTKAERNRVGMVERSKYLPIIGKLRAEMWHAAETLEADGDEHGVASVLRKALRDTATTNHQNESNSPTAGGGKRERH